MKAQKKLTKAQVEGLLDFTRKAEQMPSEYRNLTFLYNPLTPEDVYAKFVSYGLTDDNGILATDEVICIKNNGAQTDCYEQFSSLREKMAFAADFIVIDIEPNGRIKLA